MGQYHYPCNLDRREYLDPHKFGDGLKLLEFGCSGDGTMTGLAVLLSCSNDRGGGDLHGVGDLGIAGRWSGEHISIIGDYADDGDPGIDANDTPWTNEGEWTDISEDVIVALKRDPYLAKSIRKAW